MRQLMPRRAASWAAAVIGTGLLVTACGNVKTGSSASGGGSPSPTAIACATPATPSSSHVLTLSSGDAGKTLCVKVGTGVLVYLHGSMTSKWAPIQASSTALAPRANGRMMLALGVTGAYFVAVRPGTVTLTSTRHSCGTQAQPTAPATSSDTHCTSLGTVFHVTLVVGD